MADAQGPQPPAAEDPFGKEEPSEKKDERYNTRYLVANLKRDDLRGKLIVLGLLLGATIVLIVLLSTQSAPVKPPPVEAPAATASP